MPPRRNFGATWWGKAWLDALEGRAIHDPNRLPRGRTYARQDRAAPIEVNPGSIATDDEWDVVLDAITAKAARAAALLDGELDPGLVEDCAVLDVELLPRSGELRTACSCPDWAEPCKHAAAVCYLMADALDADPFALLLLRGMDRESLLAAVRSRRGGAVAATAVVAVTTVPADEAWARAPGAPPHLPPPPPDGPGRPAPWPSDPPAAAPFTAAGLRALAMDAAARAWAVRAGTGTSGLDLDEKADLARRYLADPFVASRAGVPARQLAVTAAAYAAAGAEGVRLIDEPAWPAPPAIMAAARDAVGRGAKVSANRVTAGDRQFRYRHDGRWLGFTKVGTSWHLAGVADDLDDLLR
jgi:hypothetical protein